MAARDGKKIGHKKQREHKAVFFKDNKEYASAVAFVIGKRTAFPDELFESFDSDHVQNIASILIQCISRLYKNRLQIQTNQRCCYLIRKVHIRLEPQANKVESEIQFSKTDNRIIINITHKEEHKEYSVSNSREYKILLQQLLL